MNRVDLVNYIQTLEPESDSNVKFMMLMYSRLRELGIPAADAEQMLAHITFDFRNIPEDDDTLSDIATEYADYCKKVYDKMTAFGLKNSKLYDRLYNRVYLKVDR